MSDILVGMGWSLRMLWLSLWLSLFALAGCGDEEAAADAAPADLSAREGIIFPDVGRGDAGQVDAPLDAPSLALEASGPDAPQSDAPPVDLPPPDQPQPDQPLPDQPTPDQPLPSCSSWSHYSCQPGSSPYVCTATCTLRASWVIRCINFSFFKSCSCIKNGNSVGTCTLSGTGCPACQNVVSCCFSKF